jgi:hypothetical protein
MTHKRIRITDRLRREADNCFCRISAVFQQAQREGTPLNEAAARAREIRAEREWPPSISYEIYLRTDALWKFLVQSEAKWQLYLDGEPTTSNAVSHLRAEGDEDVWDRLHGLMEWRSHPGKPFYVNEGPQPLNRKGA